jgi:beta-glucosidase
VLTQRVQTGLLDEVPTTSGDVGEAFDADENRDLARALARESVTLLSNDGVLPFETDTAVALVGPKADAPAGQLGDYAYAAHYPEASGTRRVVTPRDAFEETFDAVSYARGCSTTGSATDRFEAAAVATDSDVVVACVGARSAITLSDDGSQLRGRPDLPTSGEGADVTQLSLPGVQQSLLERLHETGTPPVVVQVSGKPHTVTWADEHADAVVHAWLPGEEGGTGLVDVLTGEHNPSCRLPYQYQNMSDN